MYPLLIRQHDAADSKRRADFARQCLGKARAMAGSLDAVSLCGLAAGDVLSPFAHCFRRIANTMKDDRNV
jgi:hypothetical protein